MAIVAAVELRQGHSKPDRTTTLVPLHGTEWRGMLKLEVLRIGRRQRPS